MKELKKNTKYICINCSKEIKEITNFCPHCGSKFEIKQTTFIATVEIRFIEKPRNCNICRFSKAGYEKINEYSSVTAFRGNCLLDPEIKFTESNKDNYYGFYLRKIENCPLIKQDEQKGKEN